MEFLQITAGVFVGQLAASVTLATYIKFRQNKARRAQLAKLEQWANEVQSSKELAQTETALD